MRADMQWQCSATGREGNRRSGVALDMRHGVTDSHELILHFSRSAPGCV